MKFRRSRKEPMRIYVKRYRLQLQKLEVSMRAIDTGKTALTRLQTLIREHLLKPKSQSSSKASSIRSSKTAKTQLSKAVSAELKKLMPHLGSSSSVRSGRSKSSQLPKPPSISREPKVWKQARTPATYAEPWVREEDWEEEGWYQNEDCLLYTSELPTILRV